MWTWEQPWNREQFFSPAALAESLLELPLFLDLPFMLSWKQKRNCKVQHQLSPLLLSLPLHPSGSQRQSYSLTLLEVKGSICLIGGWVSTRAWYLYEGPFETGTKKQNVFTDYITFHCYSRGKCLHFFQTLINTFLWIYLLLSTSAMNAATAGIIWCIRHFPWKLIQM